MKVNYPWLLYFDGLYLSWFNLVKLAQWFAEHSENPLLVGEASENFNQPFPHMQIEAHLDCFKWAVRSFSMIYVLHILMYFFFMPFLGLCYFMLIYILPQGPNRAKLFFLRTSHSTLEELRNRNVWDPKDMYNGAIGILGGDAFNTGESLYVVYRRLCNQSDL